MQQQQGRFPIYILVAPEDVLLDKSTGLSRLKSGVSIETAICDGKRCVLVFTSVEAAGRYVRANGVGERSAVAIENPHDFVAIFAPFVRDGAPSVILDLASIDDSPTIALIQPVLDAMQARVIASARLD